MICCEDGSGVEEIRVMIMRLRMEMITMGSISIASVLFQVVRRAGPEPQLGGVQPVHPPTICCDDAVCGGRGGVCWVADEKNVMVGVKMEKQARVVEVIMVTMMKLRMKMLMVGD